MFVDRLHTEHHHGHRVFGDDNPGPAMAAVGAMGSMITLRLGRLEVDWGKNSFFRNHSPLFAKIDHCLGLPVQVDPLHPSAGR
jgi:hypothetical protein